jgi:mRNA-degrading endonuclease RelE of RelBE toxin-antitoxin system
MKVTVRITQSFKAEVKPLLKKYRSLTKDLSLLEKELIENPRLGIPLGRNAFKIRLKITSKRKGKSGGARVISLVESTLITIAAFSSEEDVTVYLLSIYDKSEVENISDKELSELLKNFKEQL